MNNYPHLAEEIQIGPLTLKNRIMKNGTGLFWDDPSIGSPMTEKNLAYFEALARGGAALVSSGSGPLTRDLSLPMPGFRITTDEAIPGWRKWADTVHAHDCFAFGQLFHLGPMTPLFATAPAGFSASSIPRELSPRPSFTVPTEATVAQIDDVVAMFAEAAERQKKAGLDGTEINGACNHFLNNFLSRAWNKRTDEYGTQTIENRTRPYVQVIREIKRRNGADWPIIALFNGREIDLADGITMEEAQHIGKAFVEAGADALEIRVEYYTWTNDVERRESLHFPDLYLYPHRTGPIDPYVDASRLGAGANIPIAAEIKKVVDVPVITVGRLDWEIGEKAIAEGKIDIISMNRRLLADPDLPLKVFTGKEKDINPCSSCMTCFDAGEHFRPVACRVNASFGREREYAITKADDPKRIVVIGGGPAGMEAARVAALRGHQVTVLEKQHKLGGSLGVAAMVKGPREDIPGLIAYLDRQVHQAGVDVRTGTAATREAVAALNPDAVIIATGGIHDIPQIPGIDGRNVLTGKDLHTKAKALLRFTGPLALRKLQSLPGARDVMIGKRVVIMGGRLHGCQTAEYLIGLGKKVTIVDTASEAEIGKGLLEVFLKPYLLYWLKDQGVEFVTEAEYRRVTAQGLVVSVGGVERLIEADTVLTALPLLPDHAIQKAMAGVAETVVVIGDAADPQLIIDAIATGAKAGHTL
jgi:2,4-dienoyl-CoA reductase (NADPH2)